MARTKSKSSVQIRRVKSKEDRKRPSVFMRLKPEESFKGYAIFEPDPEADNNLGYFEYYDHWDQQGNSYVPCAGERCPFCAANDNPATRALTVWYFPDNDANDQIKVFTMNYSTTTDISDEAEEEGGILGKRVRIKRMDDRGDYKVRVLSDKPLTKAELKKVMKLVEEKFPNGLEAVVLKQLQAQMERLKALDALEDDDDDDDDEETTSRARKGKAVETDEDEDDDEDEADESDDEEDDEDDDDDDEAENSTDDEEDDEDDDDEDDDEEDDEETDDDAEEEATEIEGQDFTVVKFQEKDEILDVTDSDGAKIKMWVGEGVDVDADAVKKGVTVTLDAQQDDEGDWIITDLTVKKAKGGKKSKAGGKKKK